MILSGTRTNAANVTKVCYPFSLSFLGIRSISTRLGCCFNIASYFTKALLEDDLCEKECSRKIYENVNIGTRYSLKIYYLVKPFKSLIQQNYTSFNRYLFIWLMPLFVKVYPVFYTMTSRARFSVFEKVTSTQTFILISTLLWVLKKIFLSNHLRSHKEWKFSCF